MESNPPRTVACTYAPSSRTQLSDIPAGSSALALSAALRTRSTTFAAFASPFFVIFSTTAGSPLKYASDSARFVPKWNFATSRR